MFSILMMVQVVVGLSIIGLVLLQQGKGADMGAAFGSGASGTVFGSRGGGSFFTRTTAVLAAVFFINSVLLSSPLIHDREKANSSVTDNGLLNGVVQEAPSDSVVTDMPPADFSSTETTQDLPLADLPDMPATEPAIQMGEDDSPSK